MSKRAKSSLFAASRIKKIMQEDEDVGKMSAGVPIAVSKAIELFIRDLVSEAGSKASEKSAKKLSAYHVKRTVLEKPCFTFLTKLVEDIGDPVEADEPDEKPKRKRKAKDPAAAAADGDDDDAAPAPKKPRKKPAPKTAKAEPTPAAAAEAAPLPDDEEPAAGGDMEDEMEAIEPTEPVVTADAHEVEEREPLGVDEDYD